MPRKKMYRYRLSVFAGLVFGFELIFWILAWQLMRIFGIFSTSTTAEKLTFLNAEYAWFFLLIPILIAVFFYQLIQRNRLVNGLGGIKTLRTYMRHVSTRDVFWRFFLIRNAIVFIIFALMQPALGNKTIKGQSTGVELIFAVDISNSMNTRDMQGEETRLDVAKRAMNQLVNQSTASRVGLLIFAGNAYPQVPLTADKKAVKMYIDDLNTDFISNQGTHIAEALSESSRFFSEQKTKKVLILITDGEDHEGEMQAAYKTIKKKNIDVFVLGLGTEKGGIVPRSEAPNAVSLKDEMGRAVISKVNKNMLDEIAQSLGGEILLSDASFPNVSQFLTHINSSSGGKTVDLEFEVKENRYQWALSIGILFLMLLLIRESLPIANSKNQ